MEGFLFVEGLKEGFCPDLKANCCCRADGICLQPRSLVVDDDGLFISGPAVVEILHHNTPIFYDKEGKEVHRHEGFFDKASIVAKLEQLGVKK